ncbi:hypothetical protein AB0K40_17945 [Nonomuraea bangladeshensis]|uniref:DUF7352 domain-containing protein n=1 Tax=Nonomuraea bangladeshensis TaxID=404385 RepID=A0ABV3H4E0_9ACTN
MPEQTKTVLRYEVPIDGRPHTFRLTHSPHAVAAKRIGAAHANVTHRVEFWAEHDEHPDYVTAVQRTFQVFGTGQPIPASARIVDTTERLDGLVWHLYEVFPEEQP